MVAKASSVSLGKICRAADISSDMPCGLAPDRVGSLAALAVQQRPESLTALQLSRHSHVFCTENPGTLTLSHSLPTLTKNQF